MQKDYYVYTHSLPNRGVFYVGKGTLSRTRKIVRKNNPHHANIVNKYGKENIVVRTMLCKSEEHALALEIKMIAALRNGAVKIVNVTNGGEGTSGYKYTPEMISKRSERKVSPETCAKIAAANKGRIVSPETRAKISVALKNNTPERAAKISAALTGKKLSPETRAKIGAASAKRRHSEEVKAKIAARNAGKKYTAETCAKISASKIGKKHTPEHIAKAKAARKASQLLKKQEPLV